MIHIKLRMIMMRRYIAEDLMGNNWSGSSTVPHHLGRSPSREMKCMLMSSRKDTRGSKRSDDGRDRPGSHRGGLG